MAEECPAGGGPSEPSRSVSTDDGAGEPAPGSFEGFYRTYAETLRRALCLAVGEVDLGTDAADEAMARTCERWVEVSGYANPSGWAYRVGVNWAHSHQRRLKFRSPRPIPDSVWSPVAGDPDLAAALVRLPLDRRAVIVCRYYLDWSVDQTAAALDVPAGTVKSRLARSLDMLKQHLEGQ